MRIDGYVLAFTAAVAVAAGILAGLAFAWHASRVDLNETLKESSRGGGASSSSHRLRGLLVVTEVALALVLLTGAGLMVKGFRHLVNTNLGYDRRNVLTFQIALPESKYRDESQVREFYDQLVERLGALPGVEAAAAALNLPGQWNWTRTQYGAEGQPPAAPGDLRLAITEAVTPDDLPRVAHPAGQRTRSHRPGWPGLDTRGGVERQPGQAALAGRESSGQARALWIERKRCALVHGGGCGGRHRARALRSHVAAHGVFSS